MMDYKLYPIRLSDINRPIYYMVRTYIGNHIKDMPTDIFEEEWLRLKEKIGSGTLVFPSVDFSQQYDIDTLKREVIILSDRTKVHQYINVNGVVQEYNNNAPGRELRPFWYDYDDEEEEEEKPKIETIIEPHETHYYIDIDPDKNEYRVVEESDTFVYDPFPFTYYNAAQLIQTIDNLLPMVIKAQLNVGDWEERLQTTKKMLITKVNELHILHNGGLYDFHVLGRLLSESSIDNQLWRPLFDDYVSELKMFAMYTVKLKWDTLGTSDSLDKDAVIPPDISKKLDKERFRRQSLLKSEFDEDYPPFQSPKLIVTESPSEFRDQYKYDNLLNTYLPPSKNQKATSAESQEMKQRSREEKNAAIHKKILWYSLGMFALVGVIMLAKYSLTGSVTISVGIISGIIMRNIHRLKEGYEYDESQPQWFVPTLTITALIGTIAGFVLCMMFSEFIYNASGGVITPWKLFAIVGVIMAAVFFYSWTMKKVASGRAWRIYTTLMVMTVCVTISQCVGSLSSNEKLNQIKWEKENQELDLVPDEREKDEYKKLVGTWVHNADILGARQVVEVFNADGTWQKGNEDGIVCKGNWSYIGNKQIEIQETWVVVGETYSKSDGKRILTIAYQNDDEITFKEGDFYITFKRMKDSNE